jgi:RNA polymerase sigma factor (sigma-70 family)
MARLTIDELKALKNAQDWNALWTAAIPWVKFAASSIRTNEREDMIQVGLLKVGAALPRWNPDAGHFSTFVHKVARGAMLNFVRDKETREGHTRVMNDEDSHHEEESAAPAQLTYADTNHTPMGFGEPAREISRETAPEAVEYILAEVDDVMSLVLREQMGMAVLDDQDDAMMVKDLAAARGLPATTLNTRLNAVRKKLVAKLESGYMGITQSIYPPAGRRPWVSHQPADRRHPGFWGDLASVMGDTDAWRESVGTVRPDWSWKPTDLDIQNGARK